MASPLLIWINGPFGGGKTQTAYELRARLPGSMVFDPEPLGFALKRSVPSASHADFQDLPLWREFTRRTLVHAAHDCDGPIIVPMTVVVPSYFRETVLALRDEGLNVRHFSLVARREIVLKRLRKRGEFGRSWSAQQLDRCLLSLQDPLFADQIDTSTLRVHQVAEVIAHKVGLPILPPQRSRVGRFARRVAVQLRHVR